MCRSEKTVYIIAPRGYFDDMRSLRMKLSEKGYNVLNRQLEVVQTCVEAADCIYLHPDWQGTRDSIFWAEYAGSIGKKFLSRKLN